MKLSRVKSNKFFIFLFGEDGNYYYEFKEDTNEFIEKYSDLDSDIIIVSGGTLSCSSLRTAREES